MKSAARHARPAGAAAFAPEALRRATPEPWRRRERGSWGPASDAERGFGGTKSPETKHEHVY